MPKKIKQPKPPPAKVLSTYQLMQRYPNEQAAISYLKPILWPNGPICPRCESKYITNKKNKNLYRCNDCQEELTIRVGTIFHRSHVPFRKWLYAMYLIVTARKGISSMQLNIGRGPVGKASIVGLRDRRGQVVAEVITTTDGPTLQGAILQTTVPGSTVCTDEYPSYNGIKSLFKHRTVNHSAKQFVDGMAHTNGIESVWAVVKRGFYGVYHSFSEKHLGLYIDEFVFRLNEGNCAIDTMDRLESLVKGTAASG